MPETASRIATLIIQYLREDISEAERQELNTWLANDANRLLFDELVADKPVHTAMEKIYAFEQEAGEDWEKIRQSVFLSGAPIVPMEHKRPRWKYFVAAASVLVVLSVGGYLYFNGKQQSQQVTEQTEPRFKNDVPAPEGNRAELVLSDGSVVVLDNAQDGTLTSQGNAQVVKDGEQLNYRITNPSATSTVFYNTLRTERGGFYRLVLPDGSLVYLNAASSVTYPTAFTGNERKVTITGEAYFEVAKDAGKKFIVEANGAVTEVLGTHFNVNAYKDENSVKVTLLEGSVKTSMVNGQWSILKPGEQAVATHSQFTIHHSPDLEQVMAWKNGLFSMKDSDIQSIMREIQRWYDVEIVYEGPVTPQLFNGEISRKEPVSGVLRLLEITEAVHFKIEGRTVTVTK